MTDATTNDGVNPAHAADPTENPMDHIGPEIPDPWDDASQTDWPNNPEPDLFEADASSTVEEV